MHNRLNIHLRDPKMATQLKILAALDCEGLPSDMKVITVTDLVNVAIEEYLLRRHRAAEQEDTEW